jgi:hypothetical protein
MKALSGAFLLAMLAVIATGRNAMADSNEDPSLLLFRGARGEMASRSIALAMAEMVFKHVYGEEDFRTQVPLHITDGGDRWIIEGSRRPEDYPPPPDQPAKGNAQIVILKVNCQVVKLTEKVQFP